MDLTRHIFLLSSGRAISHKTPLMRVAWLKVPGVVVLRLCYFLDGYALETLDSALASQGVV